MARDTAAVPAVTERFGARARFCVDVDVKGIRPLALCDGTSFLRSVFSSACAALRLNHSLEEMVVAAREPSVSDDGQLRSGLHIYFSDNALVTPAEASATLLVVAVAAAGHVGAGVVLDGSI
jgi:hypothetical protein